MAGKLLAHLRQQWLGVVALLLVLTGGTAYALDGSNTVFSDDIVNGEVKSQDVGNGEVKANDLGANSVGSGKIADQQVKNADLGLGASSSNTIADGGVQGIDVQNDGITGVDVDESTLNIGDSARAYALVNPLSCFGTPVTCGPAQSKGVSSVTREATGEYCVTAPGISPIDTSAAVTVIWFSTADPAGNASAMTDEFGCGPSGEGFPVVTERQPNVTVDANGGTNNATVAGPAQRSNGVGFTIVIP